MIEIKHPSRDRIYIRRFDHEDARRRWLAGETQTALALEYGVTSRAVHHACHPEKKAHRMELKYKSQSDVCEDCGCRAVKITVGGKRKHNPDGRVLCTTCRGKVRRQRVRFDDNGVLVAVQCSLKNCANGERWQPPGSFSHGVEFRDLRPGGFHPNCRACSTRDRTAYRNAQRVPCEDCGQKMVEGKGRANSRTDPEGGPRVKLDPNRPYVCRRCARERFLREQAPQVPATSLWRRFFSSGRKAEVVSASRQTGA